MGKTSEKILVYSTNKLFEAELIKQHLMNNEIQAFILNKMDSALRFGDIELLVSQDDVVRSKKLIADYLANE
ncbi:MAG: DUF2007 domain-containing protein [Bacteroidales bacterium]